MAISLADVKHRLRIDNDFSNAQIQFLMNAAEATLKAAIGYDAAESVVDAHFEHLHDNYVAEYVRAFYFQLDNQRLLDVLLVQMRALIKESPNA